MYHVRVKIFTETIPKQSVNYNRNKAFMPSSGNISNCPKIGYTTRCNLQYITLDVTVDKKLFGSPKIVTRGNTRVNNQYTLQICFILCNL